MIIGLVAGAAFAASPFYVAGTTWSLENPESWSEQERDALSAIATRLPLALTMPRRSLALRRVAAPTLPEDLTTPHTVVQPSRRDRVLDLGLDGLDHAVNDWLEAYDADLPSSEWLQATLFDRQFVHALVHTADREQEWSDERAWLVQAGWGTSVRRRRPAESNPHTYGTVHGSVSAREDLAATVERFLVPGELPGDIGDPPACRMPSKWAFVAEQLGAEWDGPVQECADLAEVGLDPDQVHHLEVLFFRASLGHIASVAGHSAVLVEFEPDDRGNVRRDAYTLAARASEDGGPLYALRGMFGAWGSSVSAEPYRRMARRYAITENRDTLRYRLELSDEELTLALARLDELRLGWDKPYYFLHRNCSHLSVELAAAALRRPLRLPAAIPPDTLLGRLDREGRITRVATAGLEEHSLTARSRVGASLQRDAAERLVDSAPELGHELARTLRATRSRSPTTRDEAYRWLVSAFREPSPQQAADLDRHFAWSDAFERLEAAKPDRNPPSSPPLDSLRWAKSTMRQRANESNIPLAQLANPQGELLQALASTPPTGTHHTPIRRGAVGGVAEWSENGSSLWASLQTHWYDSRMGEARRYALAEGLEVSLLTGEIRIRLEPEPGLRTRWLLLGVERIDADRSWFNAGGYARVLDMEYSRVQRDEWNATWLESGLALELLQAHRHRHQLVVRAGGSARTVSSSLDPDLRHRGTGLGVPTSITGVLGSGRQALTHLEVTATWQPVFALPNTWVERGVVGTLRLRLFELGGVDVAMDARYRLLDVRPVRSSILPTTTQEAGVGFLFEPF